MGDVLKTLLNRYAREAGLASAQMVDTAERSREILNTEYAAYLKRRTEPGHDDDHKG